MQGSKDKRRENQVLFSEKQDTNDNHIVPKNPPISLEVLKKLPKADLHRHLDGSLRISTIIELAKEQHIELPTFNEKELKKLVSVDHSCESLVEYLRGFEITLRVLQKAYAITRAVYEVCEDAVKDGITYLEIRFSPLLHTDEGMSLAGVVEAACEGQAMAEYNLPIVCRLIISGMRQQPPRVVKQLAEIVWRYREKGVCAFDLAGPEYGFSSKYHKQAFDIIRSKGLFCTIHSGEAAGWESIQDSIQYCGAQRLGHGCRLIQNKSLLNVVVDKNIAVECCVTSNFHTKAVKSFEDHPIRSFFDAGVFVVPCCDNTTVSDCLLSTEYQIYQEIFKFSVEEIVRMIDYGFVSAFLGVTQKQRLRAEALHKSLKILHSHGYDISGIARNADYYDLVGVDIQSALTPTPYWGNYQNPPITKEIIRAIPKTDLHCNLEGSVSLELVWEELERAKIDCKKEHDLDIYSLQDLKNFIQKSHHLGEVFWLKAKRLVSSVLQNKDQLERGIDNVIDTAIADGVTYMELVVRPYSHAKTLLTPIEVVEIILNHVEKLNQTKPIRVGIVLYVSHGKDSPVKFMEVAQFTVKYKDKGVCGFGIYGDIDLPSDAYPYFMDSLDYLKEHHIRVAIFAGKTTGANIRPAIWMGGAARLSGCFTIHNEPNLMGFLATTSIPIETSLTAMFDQHTQEVRSFASPIRLLYDSALHITVCTFRGALFGTSRIDILSQIIQECHMSIAEILTFLGYGFRFNFSPFQIRRRMHRSFRKKAITYLEEKGFKYFAKKTYFSSTHMRNWVETVIPN